MGDVRVFLLVFAGTTSLVVWAAIGTLMLYQYIDRSKPAAVWVSASALWWAAGVAIGSTILLNHF